jgi:hypothetical protein
MLCVGVGVGVVAVAVCKVVVMKPSTAVRCSSCTHLMTTVCHFSSFRRAQQPSTAGRLRCVFGACHCLGGRRTPSAGGIAVVDVVVVMVVVVVLAAVVTASTVPHACEIVSI